MRRTKYNSVFTLAAQNIPVLLTVIFCFLLGISAGIFTEMLLSSENRENIETFLSIHLFLTELPGSELPYVFLRSAAANIILLLIITVGGLSVIGFPAALLVLIYKGAALGFSSALLIETYDLRGIFLVLASLVPQNLILIPAFLASAMASVCFAVSMISKGSKNIKNNLRVSAGKMIAFNLLMSVFVIGGCFIESFISPFLQRLLG